MNALLLAPAAFLAGVLMFLAPCTLPLIPGYLAFISGSSESDAASPRRRRTLLKNALAFVAGFSLVFSILGLFAAFIGALLGEWRFVLARGAGFILILFGLTMLGRFNLPLFSRDWRPRIPKALTLGRPESSFLVGALFALGWSPCIGPILGSVLFLASTSATALQGVLLLFVFSLGLGLPFIACALLMGKLGESLRGLSRAGAALQVLGALVLIALGFLMLLGDMGLLVSWGFGLFERLGYDRLLNYL